MWLLYLVPEEGRNPCRESRAVIKANRCVLIMHRTHPTGHPEVRRGAGGQRAHRGWGWNNGPRPALSALRGRRRSKSMLAPLLPLKIIMQFKEQWLQYALKLTNYQLALPCSVRPIFKMLDLQYHKCAYHFMLRNWNVNQQNKMFYICDLFYIWSTPTVVFLVRNLIQRI